MSSGTSSVLSPSLSAKLAALKTRPPTDSELDDILSELAALPAQLVVRASREIATSAGLGWWPEAAPTNFSRLIKFLLGFVPSDRALLAANPNFAWLFLFHPNGYLRERALHRIVTPPTSPFFLAALAWRLNDWVRQVRHAAQLCAGRVLPHVDAHVAATAALYLLDRRTEWGRWTGEQAALDQLLARKDVLAALAAQLRGPTGPLVACLRRALRYPDIDRHLLELARHARQPSVRALAYRSLIAGRADWIVGFEWEWIDKIYFKRRRVPRLETRLTERADPAAGLIREAARDKSAVVRKVAADALIAGQCRLPDQASFVAELAKDKSPAVRSRADFLLRHPPSTDAPADTV